MDEDPKEAIKTKENASVSIGAQMVNDGIVDGLVSAGNTGGTILAAAKHIPVIECPEQVKNRDQDQLRIHQPSFGSETSYNR